MENKPIDQLNSDELSNMLVEKQKELQGHLNSESIAVQEKYRLEKEIAKRRLDLLEIKGVLAMSENNIKRIRSELKMLERLFWDKKNGG